MDRPRAGHGGRGTAETHLGAARPVSAERAAAMAFVVQPPEPPVPRRGVVAGALASALAGGAVAVLGLTGASAAVAVGALVSGVVALGSGLLLVWRGSSGPRRARFRQLLGASLVVWSAGQLVNGVAVISGVHTFPTPGDTISLLAAPFAVAGVLAVPRSRMGAHPGWRLGLDASLLGVGIALLLWHFVFRGALGGSVFTFSDVSAVVVLVADITIVCLGVLAYIRDFDRDLGLVLAGAACYAVGDLVTVHSTLRDPGAWPWTGAMLWCLAWPLIAAGLLRYQPVTPPPDRGLGLGPIDPDARGVAITTTVSLAMLVVSLGVLIGEPDPDRTSIALVLGAVVVFWARELLNARFRAQLLLRLHSEATADPLTGLANRRVLAARMEMLPPGEPWCLLTVDLDGFKDVNDLLGHGTGDKLLAAVARRLAEAVPDDALVSRIGGDEFAVLLPGEPSVGAVVGERIVAAVRRSANDVEGVTRVEVSASVGVAAVQVDPDPEPAIVLPEAPALPPGVQHPGQLPDAPRPVAGPPVERTPGGGIRIPSPTPPPLPVAEPDLPHGAAGEAVPVDPLGGLSASGAALRVAKAAGRNRVELYDANVARMRRRRLRVEERLRVAVETGAIKVLFQPIVDLRRGVLAGAEALARWDDPQLGTVDPGEFIPVAEQTGLVVALGERVLNETLSAAVGHGLFARGLRLSCNVSPVQLRVPGFHRVVEDALAAYDVPHEQLVVEVTEQVVVEEGQAVATLHQLAELGVTIAIDDFGTGYSALGYLQKLPAEVLKIDRSLTSSLVGEPRSRAITRAVLDMGRTVGLSVVVEGVETEEVADLVRRMGVGFAQGSYYGRAMPPAELAAMADRMLSRS